MCIFLQLSKISLYWLSAGSAELIVEDGASLNPLFSSSAGSESSSAPLTLPDGFNWSPLAWSRAKESLPTNGVSCYKSDNSCGWSVHTHVQYMHTLTCVHICRHLIHLASI